MKRLIVASVFISFLFISLTSAAIPTDCDNSMIAYWKLDGNAQDSKGNHHGTATGGVLYETFQIGKGAQFNGNNKITVPNAAALGLTGGNGLTIMFWFKKGTGEKEGDLVKKGNYEIKFINGSDNTKGHIEATVGGAKVSSGSLNLGSPVDPNNRNPYFLTLTFNKNSKNLTLYINGNQASSASLTSLDPSASNLVFGEGFEGLMDEVAFFNRALSQSEISSYHANSSSGKDYCFKGEKGESSTEAIVTIGGCNLPGGGSLGVGSCSSDGKYFCAGQNYLLDTLKNVSACALPKTLFGKSISCCPPGYACGDDGVKNPVCFQSLQNCSSFTTRQTCEEWDDEDGQEHRCFWRGATDTAGECINAPASCGDYLNENRCNSDDWDMGRNGEGGCSDYTSPLIKCEKQYSISCGCSWEEGECRLNNIFTPGIGEHSSTGQPRVEYRCSKNITTGECIDGKRDVNWTAILYNDTTTPPGIVPDDADLTKCLCTPGNKVGFCGEELVKAPFFSLFSLIIAILAIALFYALKSKAIRSGALLK